MAHDNMSSSVLEAASSHLLAAGYSVIPIRDLVTKAPALKSWKPFQSFAASPDTAAHWFTSNGTAAAPAMAIICGRVSRDLTVLDFDVLDDGTCLWEAWKRLVNSADPALLALLPVVRTPSGGWHVYFRCEEVRGNTKLAMTEGGETLVETRGEGGYVLAPPSPGYRLVNSDLDHVPQISATEYALLLGAGAHLNHVSDTERVAVGARYESSWDQFNHTTSVQDVVAMLEVAGWQVVGERGGMVSLRRPGKDHGNSATLFADRGVPVLYCFSTNAAPIPAGVGLSPFAVYAHLNFGGDYRQAARTLFKQQGRSVAPTAPYRGPDPTAPTAPVEPEVRITPITENALRDKVFPPLAWAVPGLIPEGLTLLVGAPKIGKSWMLLDLAMTVARGGSVYNFARCEQGEVLYLCLEDGERLAQRRLQRLDMEGCDSLHFAFKWRKTDDGGLDDVRAFLRAHPATRLVVVDTLARVRPGSNERGSVYKADYDALGPWSDLAKECGVAVVIAHHTRKMDSQDAMDLVSGSNGLAGAVDGVLVLQRNRLEVAGKLTVMGREVEEEEYACTFDKEQCRWIINGGYEQVHTSNLSREILDCLANSISPLSPKQIAEIIGNESADSINRTLLRLLAVGKVLKVAHGRYALPDPDGTDSPGLQRTYPFNNSGDGPCNFVPDPSDPSDPNDPNDPNGEAPLLKQQVLGIEKALQAVRCPSCGKQYTWRRAPYDPAILMCRMCGVEMPDQGGSPPCP